MNSPARVRGGRRAAPATDAATGVLFAASVFGLSVAGATLLRDPDLGSAAWWPSAGVSLAVLLRSRRSRWPWLLAGVLAGTVAANLASGAQPATAALFGAANTIEVSICAALYRCRLGPRSHGSAPDQGADRSGSAALTGVVDGGRLLVAVCAAVGLAAAFLAAGSALTGRHGWLPTSRGYLAAHLLGMLLTAPPVLLAPGDRTGWRKLAGERGRNLEWAVTTALTVALVILFFWVFHGGKAFMILVPMLWAVARLGPLRAMLTMLAADVVVTYCTIHGHGDFAATESGLAQLWTLQAFLAASFVVCLPLVLADSSRAAALAELSDSEQLFRGVFEGGPVPKCLVSLDPADPGRILRVNAAFCALLGYRSEDLVGRRGSILTGPAGDAGASTDAVPVADIAGLRAADLVGGAVVADSRERSLRRADGRMIACLQFLTVVRPQRGHPYAVVHEQDLTDRREAEAALLDALDRQQHVADQLRAADLARAEQITTLSHDLRNPLTCVQGALQLLPGEDGGLADNQQRLLDIATRNTDRAAELIDDFLTVTRLDVTDLDAAHQRFAAVDLGKLVAMVVHAHQPSLALARHHLTVAAPSEPLSVYGDSRQLERALSNLLGNAVKYTPPGGQVSVVARHRPGRSGGGPTVDVAVTDTGIGIDPDDLDRLGDRFYRAGTARSSDIPGNGLGLAIVNRILQQHHGHLSVRSVPGEGSTFTVTLPLHLPTLPLHRPTLPVSRAILRSGDPAEPEPS